MSRPSPFRCSRVLPEVRAVKQKAPNRTIRGLRVLHGVFERGLVHAVHAAAVVMSARRSFLLLGDLGDHGFGGEHQAGNR